MKKLTFRELIVLCLLAFTITDAPAQRITVNGNKFYVDGKRIWLNGTNTPWENWNDIGGAYDSSFWSSHFAILKENHINCTRVWISCDGYGHVQIDSTGYIIGPTAKFWTDLDNLMSIARNNQIYVMVALISFDHTKTDNYQYEYWRAMYNSEANRQSFVDNYAVPLANRYAGNPYLFAIDVGNELDWTWDNQGIPAANTVDLITKVAAGVHATGSGILVCQGMGAGIKYNTSAYGGSGNYIANCGLDFWNIHYYGWMDTWFSNPFVVTAAEYGLDDKPCIIGEVPAIGVKKYKPLDVFKDAFDNGYQGVMPWTSNGVDRNGDYTDSKPGTDYIYNTYPGLVYPATAVNVPVDSVTVSPVSATISVGGTTTLTATIWPNNATNQDVTWSSDNSSVATVNSSGVVTGIAGGSATITVTTLDGSKTAACDVSVSSSTVIYEAEYATLTGCSTSSELTGYSGTGYVDGSTFDVPGDKISWTVNAATAGDYSLTLRYMAPFGVKSNDLYINGVDVKSVHFKKTTSWTELSVGSFALVAGDNTIDLVATSGYTHIDYLQVSGMPGLKDAGDIKNMISAEKSFTVYPNPSGGKFSIKLSENLSGAKINIYDNSGRLFYSGIATDNEMNVDLTSKLKGFAFITIRKDGMVITKKILIE